MHLHPIPVVLSAVDSNQIKICQWKDKYVFRKLKLQKWIATAFLKHTKPIFCQLFAVTILYDVNIDIFITYWVHTFYNERAKNVLWNLS